MKAIVTGTAVWLILSVFAFFVVRFVLFVTLVCARTGVRIAWSGMPGYLERKYRDAPEAVKLRVRGVFRVHEGLKRNLIFSLPAAILVLVAASQC